MPKIPHPTTLPDAQRSHLKQAIRNRNITTVCKALGLSRELLAKLAAGIPVRPGSVKLAQSLLPRLDATLAGPRAA